MNSIESREALLLPGEWGNLILIWSPATFPQVDQIALWQSKKQVAKTLRGCLVVSDKRPPLTDKLLRFFAGEKSRFAWREINVTSLPRFKREVYQATMRIPRGRVWTYGKLARESGYPGAARAVGSAMATNPFPFAVPCHRVVRAGGQLGNYGGGPNMKRSLLQMEGVPFSHPGQVDAAAVD